MRIKAFDWAVINVLDPVYVAKQRPGLKKFEKRSVQLMAMDRSWHIPTRWAWHDMSY